MSSRIPGHWSLQPICKLAIEPHLHHRSCWVWSPSAQGGRTAKPHTCNCQVPCTVRSNQLQVQFGCSRLLPSKSSPSHTKRCTLGAACYCVLTLVLALECHLWTHTHKCTTDRMLAHDVAQWVRMVCKKSHSSAPSWENNGARVMWHLRRAWHCGPQRTSQSSTLEAIWHLSHHVRHRDT